MSGPTPPISDSFSVVQGSTYSVIVTTTITNGSPQPVNLGVFSTPAPPLEGIVPWGTDPTSSPFPEPGGWVGQYPPGFSFDVNPVSIMSGDSSIITVSVDPNTPLGTYSFNLIASGLPVQRIRSFKVVVVAGLADSDFSI